MWIAALIPVVAWLDRKKPPEPAHIRPPEFRRQAKWWEIVLLWVLLSLVSISFVGDHPYLALAIAVLGGVYLGWQVTLPGKVPADSGPTSQVGL